MKYLTQEWYSLCQRTGLHFNMRANKGAQAYDEALYLRLYKRKEKEFLKLQRNIYDVDPRFILEQDGCTLVPLDKFSVGAEINDEDKSVLSISPEDKARIQNLITEYDARPPFDEQKYREQFRCMQETALKETVKKLPNQLYRQIADARIFSLGYCTKEILSQLKKLSKENERTVNRLLTDYSKSQASENIPTNIKEKFCFHDCVVTEFTVGEKDIVMRFDTRGGFTKYNMITFSSSDIIKQEGRISGSVWLYEELYRNEIAYEAHILFAGNEMSELIIRCDDIIID